MSSNQPVRDKRSVRSAATPVKARVYGERVLHLDALGALVAMEELSKRGDYRTAIAVGERYYQLAHAEPGFCEELAHCYKNVGLTDKRTLLLEDAWNRLPLSRSPRLCMLYGNDLLKKGDLQQACEVFGSIDDPECQESHVRVSFLLKNKAPLRKLLENTPRSIDRAIYEILLREGTNEAELQAKIKAFVSPSTFTKKRLQRALSKFASYGDSAAHRELLLAIPNSQALLGDDLLGYAAYAMCRYSDAITYLCKYCSSASPRRSMVMLLVHSYVMEERFAEAGEAIQNVQIQNDRELLICKRLIREAYERGDSAQVGRLANVVRPYDPISAARIEARLAVTQGEVQKNAVLETLGSLEPYATTIDRRYSLGMSYYNLGHLESAERFLSQVVSHHHSEMHAHITRVHIARRTKNFAKAYSLLDALPSEDTIIVLSSRAHVYLNDNRAEDAYAALKKALTIKPDDRVSRCLMVYTLKSLNRLEESAQVAYKLLFERYEDGLLQTLAAFAQLGVKADEFKRALGLLVQVGIISEAKQRSFVVSLCAIQSQRESPGGDYGNTIFMQDIWYEPVNQDARKDFSREYVVGELLEMDSGE